MAKLPVALEPQASSDPVQDQPQADQSMASRIADRLFGLNGVDRYQLWPERVVRSAVTAPGDVLNSPTPVTSDELVKRAVDMSALAGTGGLVGVGESRLATEALKDLNTNPLPKQFAKGTKDDTGIWFLNGDKPIYANATRNSVDKLYGADTGKQFDNYQSVTGKNDKGSPITVWYKQGEKNRAEAEIQNFKDKANASTDAEKSQLHYQSGVNLGYPEEASRAYAYQRFGVDPTPPSNDVTLGAGPFLRPALKYGGKIYKAPVNGQHLDAIPNSLKNDFMQKAMNGEDIAHYDFGFMNHKGHFLNREDALKYAIDNGLLSPHDAKFGALTSTMELGSENLPGSAYWKSQGISNRGFENLNPDEVKTLTGKFITDNPSDTINQANLKNYYESTMGQQ